MLISVPVSFLVQKIAHSDGTPRFDAALSSRSKKGRVVLWQLVIAVITALIAVIVGGKISGISSLLAGLSCVIPNGIFFSGFYVSEKWFHKNSPATFFVMEFIKIAISIVLVVLIFWLYREVNWIAFLVSYVVALKSYIFLLSKSKS